MRKALITGASRGIGRAIALRLAEDGFALAIHYGHNREKALEVAEEAKRRGSPLVAVLEANLLEARRPRPWSTRRRRPWAGWTPWSTTPASPGTPSWCA